MPSPSPTETDDSRHLDLFCPECRYSLRGLQHARCPECGLDLSFIVAAESMIPWCDRARNPIETFIRTVGLAMFRPKRLLREFYRPVDYRAAQAFRWVCVLLAFAGILASVGVIHAFHPELLAGPVEHAGWWFIGVIALGVLLALIAITGIPSYFFHPRWLPVDLQNRAIALSYYASAPLALSVLLPLVSLLVARRPMAVAIMLLTTSGTSVFVMSYSAAICARLAHRVGFGLSRRILLIKALFALWTLAITVCVVGIPTLAYYIALIFFSVR